MKLEEAWPKQILVTHTCSCVHNCQFDACKLFNSGAGIRLLYDCYSR